MIAYLRAVAIVGGLLIALCSADGALAQKAGGTLKISFFDNPASMSLHEEATGAALRPMMGVFNNLVMYDQHVAQNSPDSIIPDLATSWSWSEDGKELTFPLRQAVHRRRRQMHLGSDPGRRQREAPRQPAPDLVLEPRPGGDKR